MMSEEDGIPRLRIFRGNGECLSIGLDNWHPSGNTSPNYHVQLSSNSDFRLGDMHHAISDQPIPGIITRGGTGAAHNLALNAAGNEGLLPNAGSSADTNSSPIGNATVSGTRESGGAEQVLSDGLDISFGTACLQTPQEDINKDILSTQDIMDSLAANRSTSSSTVPRANSSSSNPAANSTSGGCLKPTISDGFGEILAVNSKTSRMTNSKRTPGPSLYTQIRVKDARHLVAQRLSQEEGRNVPVSLVFFINNNEEDENFGEIIDDDDLMEKHDYSALSVVKTLKFPNIYNALQDADTLARAREIVFHMSRSELNQSFYRIFRYWGRIGINLLQGCLRGHGPLTWKTGQIQAILEDDRFTRWREADAITNRSIFMDVVFYLDNVLGISKILLAKYETLRNDARMLDHLTLQAPTNNAETFTGIATKRDGSKRGGTSSSAASNPNSSRNGSNSKSGTNGKSPANNKGGRKASRESGPQGSRKGTPRQKGILGSTVGNHGGNNYGGSVINTNYNGMGGITPARNSSNYSVGDSLIGNPNSSNYAGRSSNKFNNYGSGNSGGTVSKKSKINDGWTYDGISYDDYNTYRGTRNPYHQGARRQQDEYWNRNNRPSTARDSGREKDDTRGAEARSGSHGASRKSKKKDDRFWWKKNSGTTHTGVVSRWVKTSDIVPPVNEGAIIQLPVDPNLKPVIVRSTHGGSSITTQNPESAGNQSGSSSKSRVRDYIYNDSIEQNIERNVSIRMHVSDASCENGGLTVGTNMSHTIIVPRVTPGDEPQNAGTPGRTAILGNATNDSHDNTNVNLSIASNRGTSCSSDGQVDAYLMSTAMKNERDAFLMKSASKEGFVLSPDPIVPKNELTKKDHRGGAMHGLNTAKEVTHVVNTGASDSSSSLTTQQLVAEGAESMETFENERGEFENDGNLASNANNEEKRESFHDLGSMSLNRSRSSSAITKVNSEGAQLHSVESLIIHNLKETLINSRQPSRSPRHMYGVRQQGIVGSTPTPIVRTNNMALLNTPQQETTRLGVQTNALGGQINALAQNADREDGNNSGLSSPAPSCEPMSSEYIPDRLSQTMDNIDDIGTDNQLKRAISREQFREQTNTSSRDQMQRTNTAGSVTNLPITSMQYRIVDANQHIQGNSPMSTGRSRHEYEDPPVVGVRGGLASDPRPGAHVPIPKKETRGKGRDNASNSEPIDRISIEKYQRDSDTSLTGATDDPVLELFTQKDLKGMTAFMLGIRRNHIGLIKFLLKEYEGGRYAETLILEKNEFCGNETPFMMSCKYGFEILSQLMLSCVEPDSESGDEEDIMVMDWEASDMQKKLSSSLKKTASVVTTATTGTAISTAITITPTSYSPISSVSLANNTFLQGSSSLHGNSPGVSGGGSKSSACKGSTTASSSIVSPVAETPTTMSPTSSSSPSGNLTMRRTSSSTNSRPSTDSKIEAHKALCLRSAKQDGQKDESASSELTSCERKRNKLYGSPNRSSPRDSSTEERSPRSVCGVLGRRKLPPEVGVPPHNPRSLNESPSAEFHITTPLHKNAERIGGPSEGSTSSSSGNPNATEGGLTRSPRSGRIDPVTNTGVSAANAGGIDNAANTADSADNTDLPNAPNTRAGAAGPTGSVSLPVTAASIAKETRAASDKTPRSSSSVIKKKGLTAWSLFSAKNTEQKTAIMLAAQYNRVSVCRYILVDYEGGRWAEKLLGMKDLYGNDLMSLASIYGSNGVLQLLKENFPHMFVKG